MLETSHGTYMIKNLKKKVTGIIVEGEDGGMEEGERRNNKFLTW